MAGAHSQQRVRTADEVELSIEYLNAQGLGVARLPGDRRPIHVEDALTEERVRALVTHAGQSTIYSRQIELVSAPSAKRRRALPCSRWTAQSPCRLMHLERSAQLEHKREMVRSELQRHGLNADCVEETQAPSDEVGWRARSTYVAGSSREGLVLGAYRRGSHVLQNMLGCPLEAPALTEVAEPLQLLLRARGVAAARKLSLAHDGGCGAPQSLEQLRAQLGKRRAGRAPREIEPRGLSYVALRSSSQGAVSVCLLTPSGQLDAAASLATELVRVAPRVVGVFLGQAGRDDSIFGDSAPTPLCSSEPLVEHVGGLVFELSPRSFFQVNIQAAAALQQQAVALALDGLDVSTTPVVDVYAGAGALALRMAQRGAQVTAIEVVAEAVESGEANAARNDLSNRCQFLCGDAETRLRSVPGAAVVVLNPPRRGAGGDVMNAIGTLGPARVVYVSCNPATLARDLETAHAHGLILRRAIPYDLFPQSEHVEVLAYLSRS